MSRITYHVVQSFITGTKGIPYAAEPLECRSAGQALKVAAKLAAERPAVVAFSRTGDPDTGDFEDATVIAVFGELPEFADEMAIAV